ncbi:MAG: response regulator transcription factor [Lachnospiraceae bacterium]|nr:response regulator transcription factor [Lachnospiraceae bacterium]
MRVAICDDSQLDAKRIEWALTSMSADAEISYYSSGHAFIEAVESGILYDVVFLDIYMPGENGVDVAERIRELLPDIGIIFSTSSPDHAVEAFKVQAVDYLIKPSPEIDIVRAFTRVGLASDRRSNTVLIKAGGEILVFNQAEVARIESDKHYTHIITTDGTDTTLHMNYSDVAAKFTRGFMQVKRGLTVRMDQIQRISGDMVHMSDGLSFKMSRERKDELVKMYLDYMEGKSASASDK